MKKWTKFQDAGIPIVGGWKAKSLNFRVVGYTIMHLMELGDYDPRPRKLFGGFPKGCRELVKSQCFPIRNSAKSCTWYPLTGGIFEGGRDICKPLA